MKVVVDSMFDFGLFLTVFVAIFSTIGIVCIGIGAYAVLRNELQDKIEKNKENNKIHSHRLIGR